jgi:hypothetical protein
MAVPNLSEIAATTLENRSGVVADGVSKNNAFLAYMKKSGNMKKIGGGSKIYQELSYAENGNGGWFAGYDLLPVAGQDVLSAAEFNWAQCAVPVAISGIEQAMNSGKEGVLDLLAERIANAESTMANIVGAGLYSDGTGTGGKQITGLDAAAPSTATASQSNTYGGISRSTWSFWRSYAAAAASYSSTTIQAAMNLTWAKLCRGSDKPNVIIADDIMWGYYLASLQGLQRFTDSSSADLGFPTMKYMGADLVLDGAVGGFATTKTMYFLNTKYLFFKTHKDVSFTTLGPKTRSAINQDASVTILGLYAQMTASNCSLQGRLIAS